MFFFLSFTGGAVEFVSIGGIVTGVRSGAATRAAVFTILYLFWRRVCE
jgi:hypothetical protein